jgi:hypothetical protein
MPTQKTPTTLRGTSIRKVTDMIRHTIETWIQRLSLPAASTKEDYLLQVPSVMKQCSMVHEYLASLPTDIADDLTSQIIRICVNIISDYDESDQRIKPTSPEEKEIDNDVCINMFKSVLLPSTKIYDTSDMSSGFAQELIIQTFNVTCNLTHLLFDTETETNNSALLASNIQHLTQLVFFQYNYDCTDEVVRQLALHCRKLHKIDVSYSRAVSNCSVHYLQTLKTLSDVNVSQDVYIF